MVARTRAMALLSRNLSRVRLERESQALSC